MSTLLTILLVILPWYLEEVIKQDKSSNFIFLSQKCFTILSFLPFSINVKLSNSISIKFM